MKTSKFIMKFIFFPEDVPLDTSNIIKVMLLTKRIEGYRCVDKNISLFAMDDFKMRSTVHLYKVHPVAQGHLS